MRHRALQTVEEVCLGGTIALLQLVTTDKTFRNILGLLYGRTMCGWQIFVCRVGWSFLNFGLEPIYWDVFLLVKTMPIRASRTFTRATLELRNS